MHGAPTHFVCHVSNIYRTVFLGHWMQTIFRQSGEQEAPFVDIIDIYLELNGGIFV